MMEALPLQPAALHGKVEVLRTQLKIDAGLSVADAVAHAVGKLGLESEVKGLNLVEKADKCLSQVLPTAAAQPMATTMPFAVAQPAHTVAPQQPAVMQRAVQSGETPGGPELLGKPAKSHAGLYLHCGLCGIVPNCVTAPDDRTLRMRGCFLGWPLCETYTTLDGIRYETPSDSCGNHDVIESMAPCFCFNSCILGPGIKVVPMC